MITIIGIKDLVSTVKSIRVRVCGKWEINIECMFLWIESYGLNRKPWACACTSHFLWFLCFCFIVVALVFYNCVLCFVFFIVCFVHWRLCYPPTIRLFSCCSTFLLRSFCWTLILHSIAPFILTHISLFCYRPIVQLEFFFSSKHHACTLALL